MAEPGFFDAPTTIEDVVTAYRWILGRDPRSPEEAHSLAASHPTHSALRTFMLATKASLHEHLKARFGPEKWVMAEIFDGRQLWLNLCDRHVSMGGLVGTWEAEETRFMASMLKPGQVVVDVGANIGWFSLVAAECVGPHGRVHAFEPQARIFRYLAKTIAQNDLLGRILPYEMALSDRWATMDMAWNPHSANQGNAWLSTEAPAEGSLGKVRVGVLDDILGEAQVDFLKIDTEGAEALVLAGSERILRRRRPIVMLEILPKFLERVSALGPDALLARMRDMGYRAFEIGAAGLGEPVERWPQDRAAMNAAFLPARQ